MQRRAQAVRHQIVQQPVGLLGARLRRHQAEPRRNPVHVRVHRDRVAAEREREHDRGRLRSDPGQRREVAPDLVVGHRAQPRQIEPPLAQPDLFQDRLDPAAPSCRPGRRTGSHRRPSPGWRFDHARPVGERLPQRREGALGVEVARVLGQDGEDQLVEGIDGSRGHELAVALLEPGQDRADAAGRRRASRITGGARRHARDGSGGGASPGRGRRCGTGSRLART